MATIIDGAAMTSKAAAHAHIAAVLAFPAYYGKNLDALADCLSELPRDTVIEIQNTDAARQALGDYADLIFDTFAELADETGFRVIFDEKGAKTMKLTYLGTAAAEGFPAVFCNCSYCQNARKSGGKNIRTRSQALIGDDLLIDLPADTYHHFLMNGIEGDKISHLLITHSHSDHFYPTELAMRQGAFAHDMRADTLAVHCGEGAYNKLMAGGVPPHVSASRIAPFETQTVGKYTVTALPARHFPGDGALFYIIRGDKTLLYAHDTGYFTDDVLDYLKNNPEHIDLVSYDCTNVDLPIGDDGGHMGIPNIERLDKKLCGMGLLDDTTIRVINHFSHNANPDHDLLEARVKDHGWLVSYDGRVVEF